MLVTLTIGVTGIRQALGEDARWIIRTVSGRGYVFMAEVVPAPIAPSAFATPPEPNPVAQADLDTELNSKESDSGGESRPHPAPTHRRPFKMVGAGMLIAVLAAVGWVLWQQSRPEPPAMLTMMAVPTIAVLPFEALGSHPAEASVARALYDDVITEISQRSPHAYMIAVRSTATHQGGKADLRTLGRQLDARYLVQGSSRREGDMLHINVRLIEAETGRHLSAETFQFALNERKYAVVTIAITIGIKMLSAESRRPLPDDVRAGHYVTLALAKLNGPHNSEALALLEHALKLDPNWIPALIRFAEAQLFDVQAGRGSQTERAARLSKAEDAIERAIRRDPRHFLAHYTRGWLLLSKGDPDGAIATMEYVLAMNPNFSGTYAALGRAKIEAGLAHEAIPHIEEAIRLGPASRSHHLWYLWAGQAAIHIGEYEAAFHWLQRARQANPGCVQALPWLAMAYAGLGREDEGRALIKEYLQSGPRLTISQWTNVRPLKSSIFAEQRSRIVATLKRLGVPHGTAQTDAAQ